MFSTNQRLQFTNAGAARPVAARDAGLNLKISQRPDHHPDATHGEDGLFQPALLGQQGKFHCLAVTRQVRVYESDYARNDVNGDSNNDDIEEERDKAVYHHQPSHGA